MNYEEIIKEFRNVTEPYKNEDNLTKGYMVEDTETPGSVIVMVATSNESDDGYFMMQQGLYDCAEDIAEISGVRVFGSVEELEEVVSKLSNPVPMSYLED